MEDMVKGRFRCVRCNKGPNGELKMGEGVGCKAQEAIAGGSRKAYLNGGQINLKDYSAYSNTCRADR